jgi:chromosome segregation ATPase
MMKRMCAAAGIVATISLLVCAGCTRTTGRSLESNAEFRQIKASLEESLLQNAVLEKDVEKLKGSLGEAESKLADTTTAKNGLQVQVQELTASRSSLEAKVSDLDKARINVEAKVTELTKSRDDLQKMVQNLVDTRGVLEKQVATLTKAKNAALEDARSHQKVDVQHAEVPSR